MNTLFLLEASVATDVAENWLAEGVTALISGMGGVFLILILISSVIGLFKYIKTGEITHEHKEARINAMVEKKPVVVPEEIQPVQVVQEIQGDDLELIAAITAAIAVTLDTTTDKLIVKSFRRISNKYGMKR